MLCNICKENDATVHLTEIIGDKMKKVDLCEACSKAKGVSDPTGFAMADMLFGLGAAKEMEQATTGTDVTCPQCGFSQADFKKAGRLGCAECYHTFSEGLEGLLKTMHKATKHVGKVPQALRTAKDQKDKLKSLTKKLDKAIADEDFESAAQLRDEIRQLKDKLSDVSTS